MTSSITINQNIDVLAKQCKADTDHDFGLSSDEKTIFTNNTYNRGLPQYNDGLTDLPTNEVTTLNNNMAEGPSKSSATLSTFSDYTETLNATDTITVQNYSPGLPTGQYTVKKILNIDKNRSKGGYLADNDTNTKFDLTADTFISSLGINDRAAIVVDAVSISVIDILKIGVPSPDNKTIYYAMTPEITNDPAGKVSCKSIKQLSESNTGINLVPIIEKNSGERMYNYDSVSEDSFKQFFTKYNFTLSGLKTGKGLNRKSYHYNDVTVEEPNFTDSSKFKVTISESKKQNNINTLLSSLKNLLQKLTRSGAKTDVDIFNMNREFQQKRAGDWLQVLLCKNIMSRRMVTFTEFSSPNGDNTVVDDISEVWFVTHDQIALAFALYSGVNCIFTHGHSGSIYSFRLNNPQEAMATQIALRASLEAKRNTYTTKINAIIADYAKYLSVRNNYFSVNYINRLRSDPTETLWNNASGVTKLTRISFGQNSVTKDNVDFIVKDIFQLAYKYSYIAYLKPDLTNIKDKLTVLQTIIKNSIPNIVNTSNPSENEIKRAINLNNTYKGYFAEIDNYENIIGNYGNIVNGVWTPYSFELPAAAISGSNQLFKKSYPKFQIELQPSYKMIEQFSWKNVNFNLRKYLATFGEKEYKMDSCLFLYDIKNLDDNTIVNILQACLNYDMYLDEITDDTGTTPLKDSSDTQAKKYYYVMKGFCQQVYIAIGGYSNDMNLQDNIRTKINDYNTLISNVGDFDVAGEGINNFNKTGQTICDDNTVTENNTYLQQIATSQIKNDYIYGDILEPNAPNVRQQKISDLCAQNVDINSPTPDDCNITVNVDAGILQDGQQIGGALQVNFSEYLSISNNVKQVTYTQLGSFLDSTSYLWWNNKFPARKLNELLKRELLIEADDDKPTNIINQIAEIVDTIAKDDTEYKTRINNIIAVGAVASAVGIGVIGYYYLTESEWYVGVGGSNSQSLGKAENCKEISSELGCNNMNNCSWDTDLSKCQDKPSEDTADTVDTDNTTPKPSADTVDTDTDKKIIDVFKQLSSGEKTPFNFYSVGFHPLLPIYVLLQGMYNLSFDHIDDSLDYSLIVRYFNFLQSMRSELETIYSTNVTSTAKETAVRQMAAYIIGNSINLLFIELNMMDTKINSNYVLNDDVQNTDNTPDLSNELYITKYFDMSPMEYRPIFLLGKSISEEVIGSSELEITDEISYSIQNKLVGNFFKKVNLKSIFSAELTEPNMPTSLDDFQKKIYTELIYTGEQIIRGRRENSGNSDNTSSVQVEPSSSVSPCLSGKYKQVISPSGEIIQVCDEKTLVPFEGKKMTMADIRAKEEGSPDTVYSTSSTSTSTSSTTSSNNSPTTRSGKRGGKNGKSRKRMKTRRTMKTKRKRNKTTTTISSKTSKHRKKTRRLSNKKNKRKHTTKKRK